MKTLGSGSITPTALEKSSQGAVNVVDILDEVADLRQEVASLRALLNRFSDDTSFQIQAIKSRIILLSAGEGRGR